MYFFFQNSESDLFTKRMYTNERCLAFYKYASRMSMLQLHANLPHFRRFEVIDVGYFAKTSSSSKRDLLDLSPVLSMTFTTCTLQQSSVSFQEHISDHWLKIKIYTLLYRQRKESHFGNRLRSESILVVTECNAHVTHCIQHIG